MDPITAPPYSVPLDAYHYRHAEQIRRRNQHRAPVIHADTESMYHIMLDGYTHLLSYCVFEHTDGKIRAELDDAIHLIHRHKHERKLTTHADAYFAPLYHACTTFAFAGLSAALSLWQDLVVAGCLHGNDYIIHEMYPITAAAMCRRELQTMIAQLNRPLTYDNRTNRRLINVMIEVLCNVCFSPYPALFQLALNVLLSILRDDCTLQRW